MKLWSGFVLVEASLRQILARLRHNPSNSGEARVIVVYYQVLNGLWSQNL